MNVLILSDCDKPNSLPFEAAVLGSGVPFDQTLWAFRDPSDDLYTWGIRALPCLARIVDGRAVYQVTDAADLAGFTVAADGAG